MEAERKGCICPPSVPVCVCGRSPRLRLITKSAHRQPGRGGRQPARPQRPAPGRRTDRRVAPDEPTGRTGARTHDPTTRPRGREERTSMSKRHQSSRRRSYGRRQHELRERTERQDPVSDRRAAGAESGEAERDGFAFLDLDLPAPARASRSATSGRLPGRPIAPDLPSSARRRDARPRAAPVAPDRPRPAPPGPGRDHARRDRPRLPAGVLLARPERPRVGDRLRDRPARATSARPSMPVARS